MRATMPGAGLWIKGGLEILQKQKKMIRIGHARFKIPGSVPCPGLCIFGVHENRPDPRDVGGLERAQQCILEERPPQTLALVLHIHRQPGQNHDRHRVTRQPFGNPTRCVRWRNAADNKGIESNHTPQCNANVSLGAASLLSLQRIPLQKMIQCGMTTVETINIIGCSQFAHGFKCHPSTPFSSSNMRSRALV